jgi:hypothetical protein
MRAIPTAVLVAACLALSGCAATGTRALSEEPGVRVRVTLTSGESFPATLVGLEDGELIVDRSRLKGENLRIVDRDGKRVVYLDDVPVGTAVDVRNVDVVVRERLRYYQVRDITATSRAYFGWGTAIAAVLAFFLVKILEEV